MLDERGRIKDGVVHVACLWYECAKAGGGCALKGEPPLYSLNGANVAKLSNFTGHTKNCPGCLLALSSTGNKRFTATDVVGAAALAQSPGVASAAAAVHAPSSKAKVQEAPKASEEPSKVIVLEYPHPKTKGSESFELLLGDLKDSRLDDGGMYTESTVNLLILDAIARSGFSESVLFFSTRMCQLVDKSHEKALAAHAALDAEDQTQTQFAELLEDAHLDLYERLTRTTPATLSSTSKGAHVDCLGANLSRLMHDLPNVDLAIFVRSAGLHFSIAMCIVPDVDSLHSFHLDSTGAHAEWMSVRLMPFLYTVSIHAFKIRVRDSVGEGVNAHEEAVRLIEADTLTLTEMTRVDVQVQPGESNACGPASVYFTEMLLSMMRKATEDDEFEPLVVLCDALSAVKVKKEAYLMLRPALKTRLLEMSLSYQARVGKAQASNGKATSGSKATASGGKVAAASGGKAVEASGGKTEASSSKRKAPEKQQAAKKPKPTDKELREAHSGGIAAMFAKKP